MRNSVSVLKLDVELKAGFRRFDYTNANIKQLSEGNLLGEVKMVLDGYYMIIPRDDFIEGDMEYGLPNYSRSGPLRALRAAMIADGSAKLEMLNGDNWKIVSHKVGEKYLWDKESQGTALRPAKDGMTGGEVLGAIEFNALLANKDLIPVEWEGKRIFFPGTVYVDIRAQRDFIRFLDVNGTEVYEGTYNLTGSLLGANDFVALRFRKGF